MADKVNPLFRVLDLFSGIGGFSLGLERTGGFETVAFVEINPFCQQVLHKHWPTAPQFEDVKHVTLETLQQRGVDDISVITAGFPCQPVSVIGKRQSEQDERWLWDEIIRLVRSIRPRYLILENTPGLFSAREGGVFGGILRDLASSGYDAEWQMLSAASFGASHIRDRAWIVAYPNGKRYEAPQIFNRELPKPRRKPSKPGQEGDIIYRRGNGNTLWPTPDSLIYGVADEISEGLDRYHALGNSVDPNIPEYIGHCILDTLT